MLVKLICHNCNKKFEKPDWYVRAKKKRGGINFYCSRNCFWEFSKNNPQETGAWKHGKCYTKEYQQNLYLENKDTIIERSKKYYKENKDKVLLRISKIDKKKRSARRRFLYNNSEKSRLKIRAGAHRRRTLLKNGGEPTNEILQRIYEDNIKKYGTLTCYLCKTPISFGDDHIEHKTPLSRGGTGEYNNIEIACSVCNFKKNDKTVEEYLLTQEA